jgi:hypothetical protein
MGWFGFSGGCTLSATTRAALAALNTTVAASTGAMAWTAVDYYFHSKKFSGVAFCSGAIAGMVGASPNAGFITPWCALFVGAITSTCCAFAVRVKGHFGYDDSADAWGIHGIGGFVGNILTGFFTKRTVALLDGTVIPGGLLFDGVGHLLGYNIVGSFAILAYSFCGTYVILFLLGRFPGLDFRLDVDEEIKGSDWTNMGEGTVPARGRRRSSSSNSASTQAMALQAAAGVHSGSPRDMIVHANLASAAVNAVTNNNSGRLHTAVDLSGARSPYANRAPCLTSTLLRSIYTQGADQNTATLLTPTAAPGESDHLLQQSAVAVTTVTTMTSPTVARAPSLPRPVAPNIANAEPKYAAGVVAQLPLSTLAARTNSRAQDLSTTESSSEEYQIELELELLRLKQRQQLLAHPDFKSTSSIVGNKTLSARRSLPENQAILSATAQAALRAAAGIPVSNHLDTAISMV